MEHPAAGVVGNKGELDGLMRRHQDCVAPFPATQRFLPERQHAERMPVKMDRVKISGVVVQMQAIALAQRKVRDGFVIMVEMANAVDCPFMRGTTTAKDDGDQLRSGQIGLGDRSRPSGTGAPVP